MQDEKQICPACGQLMVPVFVHGHYQCGICGTNIIPCCDGNSAENDE